jgi:hypothetical protein
MRRLGGRPPRAAGARISRRLIYDNTTKRIYDDPGATPGKVGPSLGNKKKPQPVGGGWSQVSRADMPQFSPSALQGRTAELPIVSVAGMGSIGGKCPKWSFRPHSLTLSRHDGAGPGAGCARLRPRATARLHRADRPDLSELDAAPATELLGQRRVVSGRAVAGSAFRKAPCGPARPWCEAS